MAVSPKLTVCIPAFNAEKYIGETLESIINQKANFDFQILISDDCSTDGTYGICKKYSETYNFIKIIRQEKNLGMEKNQHFVVSHPKTKYIAYIDSDDLYAIDNYLQSQFDFLEANPKIVVAFTNVELFSSEGFLKYRFTDNKPPKIFDLHTYFKDVIPITNSSTVFRSDACVDIPKFFVDYFQYDWLLHIHHGQHGLFGYNDFIGVCYRIHKNNATNIRNAEKIFKDAISLVYRMNTFLPIEYHKYFTHPLYEMNSLAFYYLKQKKYANFIKWYIKWISHVSYKQVNFRDEFYKLRKHTNSNNIN